MHQSRRNINLPANCNRRPLQWRGLEEDGLTSPVVRAMGELLSCASCYAQTRDDRRDLQEAAARAFDVANRLSIREGERAPLAGVLA